MRLNGIGASLNIHCRKQSSWLARWFGLICLLAAPSGFAATVAPGIDLGASYIQDVFSNLGGGGRRGTAAPGIINLRAGISDRAWGRSADNQFFFDYLGTFGSSISHDVGDLQGLDNIEAYNTTKLYSAWYQHDFGNSGFMLRIGKQDWNALFNNLDAAGVFINSSFGLDATTAASNVSQFPTTAVGAVIRWQSPNGVYVLGSVFDGQPGKPGHPAGTHVDFASGSGVFASTETGLTGGGQTPYKLALGGWYQTSHYDDSAGRPHHSDYGFYLLGQKRLFGTTATPEVDAFVQMGAAEAGRNPIDRYFGAGIDVTGLVPERRNDVLGVAIAHAHASRTYREVTPDSEYAETAAELTYQALINPHLLMQPDVQYIIDPGVNGTVDNALVVGVRAELNF